MKKISLKQVVVGVVLYCSISETSGLDASRYMDPFVRLFLSFHCEIGNVTDDVACRIGTTIATKDHNSTHFRYAQEFICFHYYLTGNYWVILSTLV